MEESEGGVYGGSAVPAAPVEAETAAANTQFQGRDMQVQEDIPAEYQQIMG